MSATRRRKHFHRIFAILTLLWIAWLTLVLPIQLRHRAESRLDRRLANCTHLGPGHKVTYDGECMDQAEHLYVIDKTTAHRYFSPENLLPLTSAVLGIPLFLYGVAVLPGILLSRPRQARPGTRPRNRPNPA